MSESNRHLQFDEIEMLPLHQCGTAEVCADRAINGNRATLASRPIPIEGIHRFLCVNLVLNKCTTCPFGWLGEMHGKGLRG